MAAEGKQARVVIDFLYLDRSVCSRCQETGEALEQALEQLQPVLTGLGVEVDLRPLQVTDPEQAQEWGFATSPTVRINGRDVQPGGEESECESCGDLCGESVDCRVWSFQGQEYNAPPPALFVDAILRELYGGNTAGTATDLNQERPPELQELPENLARFFASRNQSSPCCSDTCGCGTHTVDNGTCKASGPAEKWGPL